MEFKLIVISHPEKINNELLAIDQLFKLNLQRFHLRKKTWFEYELAEFIEKIDEAHYSKIVLHSHPKLVFQYNLGGFHFNKDFPYQNVMAEKLKRSGKSISISSHSICDMGEYELDVDYQFVSPIFLSISKPEISAGFDYEKLRKYLLLKPKSKFIALGGINTENILKTKNIGFDGAATLGFLWSNFEKEDSVSNLSERFIKLNACLEEENKL